MAQFYVSSLGRAKDTASLTLQKMGRTAIECEWLREFWPTIRRTDMRQSQVKEAYEVVVQNFDAVLAKHGYVREGNLYRAERANRDTIVFFCHFGLECVLLSHLMNVSPMILWHHLCAAPSSVTTVYTEERRPGKASFRVAAFGDISHLYAGGEEPSPSARFCETYDSVDERHD